MRFRPTVLLVFLLLMVSPAAASAAGHLVVTGETL